LLLAIDQPFRGVSASAEHGARGVGIGIGSLKGARISGLDGNASITWPLH
jgi:hypothetical protein